MLNTKKKFKKKSELNQLKITREEIELTNKSEIRGFFNYRIQISSDLPIS